MPNDLTPPKRGYSFKDHALSKPGQPLPGDRLDAELDRITNSFKAVQDFLTKSFDGDGSLKGSSVSERHLKPNILDPITRRAQQAVDQAIETIAGREKTTQHLVTQAQTHLKAVEKLVLAAEDARTKAEEAKKTARSAQKDALTSRSRTESAITALGGLQRDAETSANSARLAEDMAYRWAEKLDGPVFVPNGGNPVNDGFYSSKFWALYARDTTTNGSYWYLGSRPTPPTTGNNGEALLAGMWYFDTTTGVTYMFNGTVWEPITGAVGNITSVFGRQGAVQALEADYLAFYPTRAQVTASQDAQDVTIGQNTSAIAALTANLANYLPLTGGTLGGPLTIEHTASEDALIIKEQTGVAGAHKTLEIMRASGQPIFRILADMYADSQKGTVQLEHYVSNSVLGGGIKLGATDVTLAGAAAGNVTSLTSASLLSRARGDARYLQLIGGTLSGGLTITSTSAFNTAFQTNGNVTIGGVGLVYGGIQLRQDGNPNVGFHSTAGTLQALMYFNRGSASGADRAGLLTFNLYDTNGTDARVVGIMPDTIAKGGANNGAQVIQTREHADTRYARLNSGNNISGIQTINTGGELNFAPSLPNGTEPWRFRAVWSSTANSDVVQIIGGPTASAEAARLDPPGTTTSAATSIITREKGDARYAPIGGSELIVTAQRTKSITDAAWYQNTTRHEMKLSASGSNNDGSATTLSLQVSPIAGTTGAVTVGQAATANTINGYGMSATVPAGWWWRAWRTSGGNSSAMTCVAQTVEPLTTFPQTEALAAEQLPANPDTPTEGQLPA